MYWGLKNVYFRFFVKKPRSRARLKSDIALFKKPACRASSLDMREKISATASKSGQEDMIWYYSKRLRSLTFRTCSRHIALPIMKAIQDLQMLRNWDVHLKMVAYWVDIDATTRVHMVHPIRQHYLHGIGVNILPTGLVFLSRLPSSL